ncbi:MAG: RNA polymerase sigma factor [Planctomycetes bacterium]|nr:RNA polymerase sigma factor [Planctomycetota bacterium]
MPTNDPEPTDEELLARSVRGDERAFGSFVARHRIGLHRYARMLSRNDTDAEDVLQDTFLQAWRGAHAATVRSVRPWLFTIARHALQRQRLRRVDTPTEAESLESLGAAAGFADADATPERFAMALEERSLLRAALAALDDADREVIVLRELEQLSGDETAAVLGVSLEAMKSRLHRARLRLVAEVRRRLPDGGTR